MHIKVKRKYNRLDSITPTIIQINDEQVGDIKSGEEKTVELPDESAEFRLSPLFEKVEAVPVKDGDIVMISRRTIHYVLQFIALFLALSPGVMMAVNIEYWPYLIFFIIAVGIVFIIDFIIKTYQVEVIGDSENDKQKFENQAKFNNHT
ncbi:hypothetical protein [Salinicoccus sp. Marseille-QA3877]